MFRDNSGRSPGYGIHAMRAVATTTNGPAREGGAVRGRKLSVEIVAQHLRARRVAQLAHRLRLDLADALARHAVHLADLVERAWLAVGEPEAQLHHTGLPLGEGLQHGLQLVLQQRERHRVDRDDGLGVLDEVAELRVAL